MQRQKIHSTGGLGNDIFNRVRNAKNAHELWENLCALHVATDSTNEDYQPIPRYRSPRSHDHEAGGLGSASRSDLAMVAILERLIQA
jgi:hypothetical protein